jgi:hypothetical protein
MLRYDNRWSYVFVSGQMWNKIGVVDSGGKSRQRDLLIALATTETIFAYNLFRTGL